MIQKPIKRSQTHADTALWVAQRHTVAVSMTWGSVDEETRCKVKGSKEKENEMLSKILTANMASAEGVVRETA